MKLFLVPYAGGSGMYFSHWAKWLDEYVTLIPLDLPGRGLHFKEPLSTDFQSSIESSFNEIKNQINNCEYAFFGYCVGTTIVYELLKKIAHNSLKEPKYCILCANATPDTPRKGNAISDISEDELIDEWVRSSRISKEAMQEKAFLQKMYNVWKADCIMMDEYRFTGPIHKFNCDIALINGCNDEIFTIDEIDNWKKFTKGKCEKYYVDGSHDFLKTNEKELIQLIKKIIINKNQL